MKHIVLIDSDPGIRYMVGKVFKGHHYRITTVQNGGDGLRVINNHLPDIVLMDLFLSDIDGFELFTQVQDLYNLPVIIISKCHDEMMKVKCLEHGADDYLCKPFGANELLARVHVVLRRNGQHMHQTLLQHGDLKIDLTRRQVIIGNHNIRLTPTEYDLLVVLASNAGSIMTHQWLLEKVWGKGYETSVATLHVFINQLRRKIEPYPKEPRYILTEPKVGYRFRQQDQ